MELKVLNAKGQDAGAYEAAESLFGREYNEALIHQVVVAYLANARSGNRAQKGRSDIAKSTRKPWRQKGTGRARAGMASSPIWRGGGKIFPSSPEENFSHKVNRKMYRSAMASIYSKLAADGRLQVLDGLALSSPKTKEFVAALNGFNIDGSVLVIASEFDENLYLASRNVPHVLVLEANQVDPYSLVKFSHVLVMRDAVKKIEELYL